MRFINKVLLFSPLLLGVYASPILAATLVNHWSFNGNLNDSSGNNNNGTLVGSASFFVPGVFGGQGLYIAKTDYVTNSSAADLPIAGNADWSMNVWLYLTNNPVSLAYFAGFGAAIGSAGTGTSRGLIAYGAPSNLGIYSWGANEDLASGDPYPLNQWVMVTITHSGATSLTTIYSNTVSLISAVEAYATVPAASAQDIQVNYPAFAGSDRFNGIIDEFTIWSGLLASNEIAGLYATNGVPLQPPMIVTAPSPVTAYVGEYASLSVTAGNSGPFTYQWRQNGAKLLGQTNAAIGFTPVAATNAGLYTVIIRNAYGSVTSSPPALVTVLPVTNITTALGAYWTFYESNGLVVNDVSGHGNNGQMYGFIGDGSERVPGQVGQALHFRGASFGDYVVITNCNIAPPRTMTIAGWVYLEAISQWASIVKNWPGAGFNINDEVHFGASGDTGENSCYVGTANGVQIGPVIENTVLPLGQWIHVAFTADGTNLNIYRNGALNGAPLPYGGTLTTNIYTDPNANGAADTMSIGVKLQAPLTPAGGVAGFWQGSMDDLAIWNRALTPAEILSIYVAGSEGQPLTNAGAYTNVALPLIIHQPQPVTINQGGSSAQFSVAAAGQGALYYQWTTNGIAVSGGTNYILNLPGPFNTPGVIPVQVTVNDAGTTNIVNSSVTTLTITPVTVAAPRVTNLPPSNITAQSATLAADVLSTGRLVPLVTIFYGTNDGGTNAAHWASNLSLGLESGYAAVTVPGLASNTTYYVTAQASNSQGVGWAAPSFSFATLATNPPSTLTAMLTYHNDNFRDGVNSNETQLTPANVNTNTFGKLFSYSVDGYVFAQPLVMTNVIIPGRGLHNVVYVATENASVYAFDADSQQGLNSNPLWQISFIDPAAGVTTVPAANVNTTAITPEISITATPVIDRATGTLYVEVKTMEVSGATVNYMHRLHALDITTGVERTTGVVSNSPAVIAATNYSGVGDGDNDGNGHVLWNALHQESRPALTLLNGVVYVAYASDGDNNPYHGWLYGYSAQNLAQLSVYNTTPNGQRGGIWQGGGGATVDAAGNFYLVTGNGNIATDFNATGPAFSQATNNFAMSVLKFKPSNGVPILVDFFTPHDQAALTGADSDLGSGASLVLPDSAGSASHPHLLAAAGKTGNIYLIDRDNMGRFNASSDSQIVQVLTNALGSGSQNGSYMTPVFFNGTIYYVGMNSTLMAFALTNGLISANPTAQTSTVFGDKGSSSPTLTANGSSNAILWVTESDAYASSGPGILHAYNATNVANELYNSSMLPARDNPGGAVKFSVPTVVNGKVYLGTEYYLSVFGLGAFLPTPAIQPDGGFFTNQVTVSFSDSTAGVSFYYTVDGTTPTTNSTLYTVPFVLTNNALVQVIASAGGGTVSGPANASFVNSASFGHGSGLLGAYYSNQPGTFVPPPTLVRTDAVINFNWTGTSPDPSIGASNFSVSWTGCVQPQYNETYTFYTLSDTGARLWINGQLLINNWSNQTPTQASASIPMLAQQIYNIQMEYYYANTGGAVAQLSWSSPSTPLSIIPQSQLYPVSNPSPVVVMTSPTNGAALTASASVTLTATAAAQSNAVSQVAFYVNGQLFGTVTNLPYTLTDTGLAAGNYVLTAVATDTTGLAATSAVVNITVNAGSGLPYGLTNYSAAPAFYNMPPVFTGPLPALLSLTGVFTNTPAMAPAASLIPYAPNVQLFSDNAQKVRYFSVPNTGAPYTPSEQIAFAPTGAWAFPSGTVFVKTFEVQTNLSDPTSLLRLETRLLVRDTNGAVYGVTYKWRSDYSDADLLTTNLTEPIPIQTPGGVYTNLWYYPSPSDCLQCHTAVANYVLGVNARQLNGNLTYSNGVTDNQLRALNRTGLFYPAIDESQIPGLEQLSALTNPVASYVQRARSYMDANCAQCHQPGGTGPTFDARYDTPLTNQNIINVPAVKGQLGYDNVDIVTPDDVWRSSIYDRMDIVNPAVQMPPLARNLIDTNAVAVMAAWINSLSGTPALPPPSFVPPGGMFQGFVNITIEPPTNNVAIYYTLDGSLPTTNSRLYTGPFLLTNSATVNANAWEAGFVNSVVGTAQYTILPGIFFVSPGGFTNGIFQMTFTGPIGSNYVLQVSTNLTQWTSITTNTPATTPFVLSDPRAPSGSARFYRVLQEQ